MSSPPDDETDDGTVLLPSGFQRSSLRSADPHTPTLSPWAQAGAAPAVGNALPLGTRIGEFELTRVIGEGGFGVVYQANDTSLERRVAIKEYMPTELAERTSGMQVQSLSDEDEEIFQKGLQSFINEAKILARFDNASLLKVYRFWEANGTAYMVMPFYEGPTLLEALRKLHKPPDEDWLRRLLDPLTEALAVIHDEYIYHRDISPDNILLLAGTGRPLLLDFGAARRVINDANQKAPTAIVKPGYAPVEQYSDIDMKQGPWTDVYALAAVLHFAITGKKPPAAIARLAGDAYVPLSTLAAGRYSPQFLAAIDKALIVRPTERTQSMDELRAALGLKPLARDGSGVLIAIGSAPAAVEEDIAAEPHTLSKRHDPPTTKSKAYKVPSSAATPRRPGPIAMLLAGAAIVLVAGGGTWWWLSGSASEPVPPQAQGPATPVPTKPTPDPTNNGVDLGKDTAKADAPPVVPPTSPASAAAAPQPFSVVNEFARIQAQGTPGYSVTVQWKTRPTFRIRNKDVLAMNVMSMQDGYLYVLGFTPDDMLFQYFPNAVSHDNFVKRQTVNRIPQVVTDPATKLIHEGIVLTDPPGKGHILVVVSKYPRDFSALGSKHESIYPVYPIGAEAAALQQQTGGAQSIYLGQVKCPPGPTCEDQFGATMDSFDIVP